MTLNERLARRKAERKADRKARRRARDEQRRRRLSLEEMWRLYGRLKRRELKRARKR